MEAAEDILEIPTSDEDLISPVEADSPPTSQPIPPVSITTTSSSESESLSRDETSKEGSNIEQNMDATAGANTQAVDSSKAELLPDVQTPTSETSVPVTSTATHEAEPSSVQVQRDDTKNEGVSLNTSAIASYIKKSVEDKVQTLLSEELDKCDQFIQKEIAQKVNLEIQRQTEKFLAELSAEVAS